MPKLLLVPLQILLVGFALFFIVNLMMVFFQRHLIFHPSSSIPNREHVNARDMSIVTLKTSDGLNLQAWYKAAQPQHPTLLYLHGNAGNISDRMSLVRKFLNMGYGVLLLEYRGYGGNPGSPSEKGLFEDGRAGLQFIVQQNIPLQHIALYGESLGSGVAIQLASENRVCAVILQSAYTSLTALARYHYPWIWFKPRDRFDSINTIQAIQSPVLILHGKRDPVVPYEQSLALFKKAPNPKEMVSFSMSGHNDITDAPGFAKTVEHFINKHCPEN